MSVHRITHKWNEEQDAIVSRLFHEHYTAREIALAFTRDSIIGRLARLGLRRTATTDRPPKPRLAKPETRAKSGLKSGPPTAPRAAKRNAADYSQSGGTASISTRAGD